MTYNDNMTHQLRTHLIKKWLLIGIFITITITAHPNRATYFVVDVTWPVLHALGIDVFMKPFTSDMVFMYDADLSTSLYQYDFDIAYHGPDQDKVIDVRELSFHRFRVPFTWLGITAREGLDTAGPIYALCHELERVYGDGSGFTIRSQARRDVAAKYQMNQKIRCDHHE